jgi:uroporphyrinogen-III decarboxylase
MLETLVESGITPIVFYEGCWDKRLEHLAQLPKGKTVGYFQSSDIFRVKDVLGDTMCIMGGMPLSLLKPGSSPEKVREHTRRVCQEIGKDGGFVMANTVMELEGCHPELIQVWADATREFGVY